MKTLNQLMEPSNPVDLEARSREQFQQEQHKLLHQEWLKESPTLSLLKFLESRVRELHVQNMNLIDSEDSAWTRTMLVKETQTLTKVINYVRREQYTAE